MSDKSSKLDAAFIKRQGQRLRKAREDLLVATQAGEGEESEIHAQAEGEAGEAEDDAQKLALLELDGTVVARNAQRLTVIERALQKIDEGTYGLSDESGSPIPLDRLEAIPEAIYTLDEVKRREADGARPGASSSRKV
jgi:DnaK suppressor protein